MGIAIDVPDLEVFEKAPLPALLGGAPWESVIGCLQAFRMVRAPAVRIRARLLSPGLLFGISRLEAK